jgi:hypothetical protein
VSIQVKTYDHRQPIVIDPVLNYFTVLGTDGFGDMGQSITVASDGSAYITGYTMTPSFPTVNPIPGHSSLLGTSDAFVAKLAPDGQSLAYATFLGGGNSEMGRGIGVDANGEATVVGWTASKDFPTANSYQETLRGSINAFVTKLLPNGDGIVYSTYLGGSNNLGNSYIGANVDGQYFDFGWLDDVTSDKAKGVMLDADGNAYVVGTTTSSDFPATITGSGPGFVAKFDPVGHLAYSFLLDGRGEGIAVDTTGSVYVVGVTDDPAYPVLSPISGPGCPGVFVTKFKPLGNQLAYSTCVAQSYGWGGDQRQAIALDKQGNAYITGSIQLSGTAFPYTLFPTVNPYQATNNAGYGYNAYVAKLNSAGNALVYATYLGGSKAAGANAIAVDAEGNAYVTGSSELIETGPWTATSTPITSSDFPIVNPIPGTAIVPHATVFPEPYPVAFVTKFDPAGNTVGYSTFLGGFFGAQSGHGITLDAQGNPYVTGAKVGTPTAPDFGIRVFVAKISSAGQTPTTTVLTTSASTIIQGQPVTFTATVTGNNPTGSVSFLDGGNTLGTATLVGNTATYTTTTLIGGMHTVTASYGGDVQNAPSTSAPVSVMVNAPPTVSIVTPLNGGTFVNGATVTAVANANVVGGTVAQVEIYNGTTLLTTATASPYTYTFSSLSPGTYTLTAKATSTAGLSTTSAPVTITVIGSPKLQITSPAAGSFITSATAVVTGTVQTPPNSSLKVQVQQPKGGATTTVWATITPDGRFFANNVPLYTGPNIITVTLAAPGGATITRTVVVTRNGQAGFTFSANPTQGLAPLGVYFTLTNTGGTAFDHIDFTCQDGGAVQTVQGPSTALSPCTYSAPGYYTAQVNVYALPAGTSQAPIFTGVQMIQADSAVTINAVALGAYYDMLNQLLAGNVQGALNDVTGTVYDKYNAVFASVVTDPNLKTIIPKQFMNIVDGTIGAQHAEYVLGRDVNGVATGFFIDVVQGDDGVWRIEGM